MLLVIVGCLIRRAGGVSFAILIAPSADENCEDTAVAAGRRPDAVVHEARPKCMVRGLRAPDSCCDHVGLSPVAGSSGRRRNDAQGMTGCRGGALRPVAGPWAGRRWPPVCIPGSRGLRHSETRPLPRPGRGRPLDPGLGVQHEQPGRTPPRFGTGLATPPRRETHARRLGRPARTARSHHRARAGGPTLGLAWGDIPELTPGRWRAPATHLFTSLCPVVMSRTAAERLVGRAVRVLVVSSSRRAERLAACASSTDRGGWSSG